MPGLADAARDAAGVKGADAHRGKNNSRGWSCFRGCPCSQCMAEHVCGMGTCIFVKVCARSMQAECSLCLVWDHTSSGRCCSPVCCPCSHLVVGHKHTTRCAPKKQAKHAFIETGCCDLGGARTGERGPFTSKRSTPLLQACSCLQSMLAALLQPVYRWLPSPTAHIHSVCSHCIAVSWTHVTSAGQCWVSPQGQVS